MDSNINNNNNNNKRSLESNHDDYNSNSNKKERLIDSGSESNISTSSIISSSGSNISISSGSSINSSCGSDGISISFNNSINEFQNFINRNYNDIKLKELKDYCMKLGINIIGNKKELYERVKNILEIQNKFDKEKSNPFNKGRIELAIKDIENVERLFWSVFRNKSIYYKIFSNFKFSKSSSYERLHGIKYIILNFKNFREILMDKIKTSSNLDFSNNNCIISGKVVNGNVVNINKSTVNNVICSVIKKESKENLNLLESLLLSDKYSKLYHKLEMAKDAIENSNYMILKILKVNSEMINDIYKILHKPIKINISSYHDIKFIHYLNSIISLKSIFKTNCSNGKASGIISRSISNSIINNGGSINSIVGERIFEINLLFNVFDTRNKLKHFIKLIECLPLLYTNIKSKDLKIINSIVSSESKELFTLDQLKSNLHQLLDKYSELLNNDNNSQNNNISNNQSNNNNSNNNNNNNNNIKNIILKYINLLYSIIGKMNKQDTYQVNYYLIYNKDINKIVQFFDSIEEDQVMLAKRCFNDFITFLINNKNNFKNKDLVYNSVIHLLRKGELTLITKYMHLTIAYSFLEVLSHPNLGNQYIHEFIDTPDSPTGYFVQCYSIEYLDYLYYNHRDVSFLFKDNNKYCFYIKNYTILEHYEQIMLEIGSRFLLNDSTDDGLPYFSDDDDEKCSWIPPLQIFYRAIQNPSIYNIDKTFSLSNYAYTLFKDQGSAFANKFSIKLLKTNKFKSIIFPNNKFSPELNKDFIYWIFKHIIEPLPTKYHIKNNKNNNNNNNNNEQQQQQQQKSQSQNHFVKFKINLVNNNYKVNNIGTIIGQQSLNQHSSSQTLSQQEEDQIIEFCIPKVLYIKALYSIGRYNDIFQIKPFRFEDIKFITHFSNYLTIEFLNTLLYNIFTIGQINVSNEAFRDFLVSIIENNNLSAFQLILLKYSQEIFSKNSLDNTFETPVLSTQDINLLLDTAVGQENLEIRNLLLNYVNFSQKQLKSNSPFSLFDLND